ncbi:zinc finger protein 791-like isoform X2 [Artemia franciscana]|uniref:zinc finger protein 791-like isoform X2 n=1 Tax=Artemia franciscana TaxID=6661 RepID=UPI0032DB0245
MMDPLQIKTDEALELPNTINSSNDLDLNLSNSCSSPQLLVGSFTLKEEEMRDPLQIETDEPLEVPNSVHSSYDLDAPKSSSQCSSQLLVGSFTIKKEEIVDSLQIKNEDPMKVSNFSRSSYGFDTPKSSPCNPSQALAGSFTLKEEGFFRNGCSKKKRTGLVKDVSSTGETICLTSVFNQSEHHEKIYLKTTVEIEKLTKRTIEENCCGKWRCSDCGKIENSFYFLQLHKSTNCETMSKFNCEICRKEIYNYSDFAIHYIEHEADKEKKCPICLCPNVNDIKEHLIVKNHLSGDITGFRFTDNECKRSNEKAKQEIFFNYTIDGYCQDFNVDSLSQKSEKKVKKEYLSIVESTSDAQEKPNLRKRKENNIYVESSDSDIDDISDEGLENLGVTAVVDSSIHLNECSSCGKSFKDRKYLLRHIRIQHKQTENGSEDEMYECPFCQTNFEKMNHLCRHLMTHKDGSGLRCNKCTEAFSWPFELVTHLEMHKKTDIAPGAQPSENSDTELTSNSKPATNNMIRGSNFNKCGICKKTYVNRRSLLRHLGRHVKGRKYICNICDLSFFRDWALKMHIQRHTGDKKFNCDKCGKNFYTRSILNQHLKKHATEESGQRPEKLFECEICHTKFETKQGYSRHVKRHIEGKTHECGICQRKCYTKYHLTEHMRIHTGEKPYECKICNHSFAQKMGLRNHMKYHSDKRPYSCEFCSKSFMRKDEKDDHVNTHSGNKPYKCKQCNMRFGSRKSLKKHEKVHARNREEKKFREKKHSCNICSEAFAVADYRDKHVALHANPNPFSCEFCSKNFNYKKNLVAHVQRVHPNCNPFRCKLCSKTYDTIRKIEVHINSRACVKNNKSHKQSKNQGKSIEVDGNTNGENLFICNICNEEFLSVEKVHDHFNSCHDPSK